MRVDCTVFFFLFLSFFRFSRGISVTDRESAPGSIGAAPKDDECVSSEIGSDRVTVHRGVNVRLIHHNLDSFFFYLIRGGKLEAG